MEERFYGFFKNKQHSIRKNFYNPWNLFFFSVKSADAFFQ